MKVKEITCDIGELERTLMTLEEDASITVTGNAKNGDLEKIRADWWKMQRAKPSPKETNGANGARRRWPPLPKLALNLSALENVTKIEGASWVHFYGDNASFCEPDDIFHCRKLVSLVLPKNLVEIGERTFVNCRELESLEMPKGVKIGKNAFCGCEKLDLRGIVRQTALFIHGFGGSGASSTGKCVEKALSQDYDFIKPDFDLTDVDGTLAKIRKIIKSKDIKLIAGTSLGAFYTLACGFNDRCIRRLAINPCMKPSEEIPKLMDYETGKPVTVPEATLERWRKMEEETYRENAAKNVAGLFADNDELFGNKYHELFARCYGNKSVHTFEGAHHGGGEKLTQAVRELCSTTC